jgi:hypothetical protein
MYNTHMIVFLFFDNPGAPGLSKYQKTIIDFLVMNTGMIQSEYMATANQLEKFAGMATKR